MGDLQFKIASEPWELEAIHRLNYQTFVEEIPQHGARADGRLVDRFHQENTYLIALDGATLCGMLALRGKRPFSLDLKLPNLDDYLPPNRRVVEVRLLTIQPAYRTGPVLRGLLIEAAGYCLTRRYNLVVISGTTRQLRLYHKLGFVPFGPLVGEGEAWFQPMYLTAEAFFNRLDWVSRYLERLLRSQGDPHGTRESDR